MISLHKALRKIMLWFSKLNCWGQHHGMIIFFQKNQYNECVEVWVERNTAGYKIIIKAQNSTQPYCAGKIHWIRFFQKNNVALIFLQLFLSRKKVKIAFLRAVFLINQLLMIIHLVAFKIKCEAMCKGIGYNSSSIVCI